MKVPSKRAGEPPVSIRGGQLRPTAASQGPVAAGLHDEAFEATRTQIDGLQLAERFSIAGFEPFEDGPRQATDAPAGWKSHPIKRGFQQRTAPVASLEVKERRAGATEMTVVGTGVAMQHRGEWTWALHGLDGAFELRPETARWSELHGFELAT